MVGERDSICYLCGTSPATEREHVFPRLLFPPGLTNLPPRLPACHECNNGLSQDEEIFQQFLMSWRTLDTEQGKRVYDAKAGPNLRSGRAIRQKVLRLTEFVPLVDESGQTVGTWPIVKVPPGPIERVLGKMARGLHYYENHEVLPTNADIFVQYAGQDDSKFGDVILPDFLATTKRIIVGVEDVLTIYRTVANDSAAASMNWFVFYRWHLFFVGVLPIETIVPTSRMV